MELAPQLTIPNASNQGSNNIGGVTIEGKITRYELTKSGNSKILFATIFGNGLSMDIMLSPGPYTARVEVRSSTSSDRIIFSGVMKLPEESKVYIGRELF